MRTQALFPRAHTAKPADDHYLCSIYQNACGKCSCHYIREAALREVVLERIRAVTDFVRQDVEGFQEEWLKCRRADREKAIGKDKRRLAQIRKRLENLDTLMTRVYEDKVLGGLSEERYRKMTDGYEAEQEALQMEADALEKSLDDREEIGHNLDRFIALTKKYVDITELTPTIVNEFIREIIVYEHSGYRKTRQQEIRIVFNFLDETEYQARESEEAAVKAIEAAQNAVIEGWGR